MTTDITELAQSLKRRAASANEFGEGLFFIKADDVLALVEALEKSEKTSEARREAIDRAHNMFVRERDSANAAEEALEKAQIAGSINNQWKPDVCPITGRRFFMWIEHPELGYVPTYGGPYDSYTIPTRDGDGEFSCERYDHDVGGWVDGECVGAYLIDDDEQSRVYELEQRIAELEESHAQVIQSRDHYKRMLEEGLEQLAESRTVTVKLPDLRQIVSGDRYVWSDGVYNYSQDVKAILAAAGIKVEAE